MLYNWIFLIKKELQILDHYETTYNFEVEDNHNYFVSDSCILVHNDCVENPPKKITGYTKHGLEQVMGRENHGVSLKGILDAWKNPKKIIYDNVRETFKYIGEKSIIVLNRQGEVVTAIAKSSKYWRY